MPAKATVRLFGIVPVRGRRTTDREIPEGKGGPPDVKKYTLKRILTSLFTLLAILLVLFILMQLMPGSPFNDEKLTPDMRAALYAKYGLDQPSTSSSSAMWAICSAEILA